ncbi:hypothetical protein ACHAW6_011412, partial [Cyclotella cf. meneghiniana]
QLVFCSSLTFASANPRTRLIALENLISRTSTATIFCTAFVRSERRGAADSHLSSSLIAEKSPDCKTSTTALIFSILNSSSMLLSHMLTIPSIATADSSTGGSLRNTPVLLV